TDVQKESRQTALARQGPPSRDAKRRRLLAVMTLRDGATSRTETGVSAARRRAGRKAMGRGGEASCRRRTRDDQSRWIREERVAIEGSK
ncbi:hypothetical protein PIB30_115818, partial [Stylosanthes scabra]|nr:hypothetical protein [Stylosanthes scabra]